MSEGLRRRGRPPISGEAKRASFHTRIRESLKQRLDAEALTSGRSLSEEIEHRLEQSFHIEREEAIGESRATRNVMSLVRAYFTHRGQGRAIADGHTDWSPREWIEDPETYEAAMRGAIEAFWTKHPARDVSLETKRRWYEWSYERDQSRELNKDPFATGAAAAQETDSE